MNMIGAVSPIALASPKNSPVIAPCSALGAMICFMVCHCVSPSVCAVSL